MLKLAPYFHSKYKTKIIQICIQHTQSVLPVTKSLVVFLRMCLIVLLLVSVILCYFPLTVYQKKELGNHEYCQIFLRDSEGWLLSGMFIFFDSDSDDIML
jgi:hypothetical protein